MGSHKPKKSQDTLSGSDISLTSIDVLVQGIGNPLAGLTAAAKGISDIRAFRRVDIKIEDLRSEMYMLIEEIRREINKSTQPEYDFHNRYSGLDAAVLSLFNGIINGTEVGQSAVQSLRDFQQANRVLLFPTMFPEGLDTLLNDPLLGPDPVELTEEYSFDSKKLNIVAPQEDKSVVYPIELGHLALLLKEVERKEGSILTPVSLDRAKSDVLIKRPLEIPEQSRGILAGIKYFFFGEKQTEEPASSVTTPLALHAQEPSLEAIASIPVPKSARGLAFSPDGSILITGNKENGRLLFYNLDSTSASVRQIGEFHTGSGFGWSGWHLDNITHHPNDNIVLARGRPSWTTHPNYILAFKYLEGSMKRVFKKKIPPFRRGPSLSPDGKYLVCFDKGVSGSVSTYSLSRNRLKLKSKQTLLPIKDTIHGAEFTSNGRHIAVGIYFGGIFSLNFHAFSDGLICEEPSFTRNLMVEPYSRFGMNLFRNYLAVVSNPNEFSLNVLDLTINASSWPIFKSSNSQMQEMKGMAFSQDGKYFATVGGGDLMIYKFNVEN